MGETVRVAQLAYEEAVRRGLVPGGTQNYPFILGCAIRLNAALTEENERYKGALKTIAATPGYGSLGTAGLHSLARIALADPEGEWVELTPSLRIRRDGSEWEQMPEDYSDITHIIDGYRAALLEVGRHE